MEKPRIAATKPVVTTLEPGEYHWCTCGRSENQPYCDGSHRGTSFAPLKFTMEKADKVALCTCKLTGKPPFCDGAHKGINARDEG